MNDYLQFVGLPVILFQFYPNPGQTRIKSGYKLDKGVFVKYLYKIKIKFKYFRISKSW